MRRLSTIEEELEKINSEKLKQEMAKTVRVLESYDEIRNYMRLAEVNIEETGKKEKFLKDRIETMQYQVSELQRKLQKIHLKIEVIEEIMSQHIGKDPDVNIAKIQSGKPDICEDNDILTKLDSIGMWSGLGTCQAYVVNDLIEKKCLKSEIIKKASESKESLKMYLLSLGVRENYIDKIYPVLIKNQIILSGGQINFEKIQKIINLHTKKIQNKIEKKKK